MEHAIHIKMTYNPSEIEYTRAALYNAFFSGLTFKDVLECVIHADNCVDFDDAVNILTLANGEAK